MVSLWLARKQTNLPVQLLAATAHADQHTRTRVQADQADAEVQASREENGGWVEEVLQTIPTISLTYSPLCLRIVISIGYTTKRGASGSGNNGGFGEGLKVGILALSRAGTNVRYETSKELWQWVFRRPCEDPLSRLG